MILTSVEVNSIILIINRTEINKRNRREECDVVVLKCNNFNFNLYDKKNYTYIYIRINISFIIFLRKREN